MKKYLNYLSWVMLFFCKPCFAILSFVYDPYDVIQNTITAKNSVQSLINQAQQVQSELQNLKSLSKGHFENTLGILDDLTNLSSQGKALSYGLKDMGETFSKNFPGFKTSGDYNQNYQQWSNVTYDTLKSAMMAMSLQGKLFTSENQHIRELQTLSDGSSGNLAAHQTSHRIALEEISQLQKLRQLLLTQSSTQSTFMTYQLQKEQAQQAAMHEWIAKSQIAYKRYDGTHGFGANDFP